jgi:phage terminase small subunit
MWHRNQVWLHYVKNIIAADVSSAVFLASYLRYVNMSKTYAAHLEIIDLQKYKVIKDTPKIRVALRSRMNIPFVFAIGKN